MSIFFLVLTCLMALVIFFDATRYLIPNWLVGLVIAAWVLQVMLSPAQIDWQMSLMIMLGTFVVGYIIFALNLMGGGDIKLLTACALWAGKPAIVEFLLYTGLLGGALAIVLLLARAVLMMIVKVPPEKLPRIARHGESVPYGLAIATSFLILMWQEKIPGLVF